MINITFKKEKFSSKINKPFFFVFVQTLSKRKSESVASIVLDYLRCCDEAPLRRGSIICEVSMFCFNKKKKKKI